MEWYRLARGVQRETRQNANAVTSNVSGVRHQKEMIFGEFSILGQQKGVKVTQAKTGIGRKGRGRENMNLVI